MSPVWHLPQSPVMPLHPAAPAEARSLRPFARAITHARIPAAVKLLLLALLAALSAASRKSRHPRKDWYPSPELDAAEHPDSPWSSRALRKIRRQRAWIGYILRCAPAEGMSLSGQRAPVPCPPLTARAPP